MASATTERGETPSTLFAMTLVWSNSRAQLMP